MTDEREPTRWTAAGSDVPHELRELVSASRARLGTSDEVARLSASLSHALGPSAGLIAIAPKAGKSIAWISAVWGGAGLIAALALSWPSSEPISVKPAPAPPAPAAAPPAAEAAPAPDLTPADVAAPALAAPERVQPAELPATPEPKAKPAPPKAPARAPASQTGMNEAALLESARAALSERPNLALSLTREHARRFREGVLAQEREVIAIEALERLGRKAEAERRALDFERRYRGSVHRAKVQGHTPR